MRTWTKYNMKDAYKKMDSTANFLVCGHCETYGETKRLDQAIQLAEKHFDNTEVHIYEYATGDLWVY